MKIVDRTGFDWDLGGLQRFADPIVFIGRALMSVIFLLDGYGQIFEYHDVTAYMQEHGVSPLLLPLVILTQRGGGVSILCGFKTRWAAIALAGYAMLTAALFHNNFADVDQVIHFQKNLAITGGFLVLAVLGPGGWSVDAWRGR
jgi:putative oxidoreductase